MTTFGWVAGMRDPPWQWDLRRLGWRMCGGREGSRAGCRHVLLADARELTLDLFHRDARQGERWLSLHPREFGVLWRLADEPGHRVSRVQLLRDVWRLNHDPETNSVEVHISRLRGKLAEFDCAGLVTTDPRGGYRLNADRPFGFGGETAEEEALDAYLRQNALWLARAEFQDG